MSLRSAAPHHGWEYFISVTHRIPMHVMFPGSKANEINYKICNKKYVCIASSSLPLSANMVSSRIAQMRSLPQMNFLQYPLRHQSHNINLKEKKKIPRNTHLQKVPPAFCQGHFGGEQFTFCQKWSLVHIWQLWPPNHYEPALVHN